MKSSSMFRLSWILPLLVFLSFSANQPPVRFLEAKRVFVLDAGNVSYIFGINERNMLQHIYWGQHVWRDEDFAAVQSTPQWASFDLSTTTTPQEYPRWGAGLYVEPSLKVTFPTAIAIWFSTMSITKLTTTHLRSDRSELATYPSPSKDFLAS
jgi:hypothetical protein